jgi:hypothetical protein
LRLTHSSQQRCVSLLSQNQRFWKVVHSVFLKITHRIQETPLQ